MASISRQYSEIVQRCASAIDMKVVSGGAGLRDALHVSLVLAELKQEVEAVRVTQASCFAVGVGGNTGTDSDPAVWPIAELTNQSVSFEVWHDVTTQLCPRLTSPTAVFDPVLTLKLYVPAYPILSPFG